MAISPTRTEGHVDIPLSNVLIARMQDESAHIADKMFPVVNVPKPSGRYFEYPPDSWFRTAARIRAPGSESAGVNFHINADNYYLCRVTSIHTDISEMIEDTMDAPIDLARDGTALVAQNLKLRQEMDWKNAYFRPGLWTGFRGANNAVVDWNPADKTVSGSFGQWDTATSDPIRDMQYLVDRMQGMTGRKATKAAFSRNVWSALINHPAIIERIKYTQSGFLNTQIIASAMGLTEICVSETVVNTSQEGQVANFGFLNSNSFLLTHTPDAPGLMIPSAGYRFNWTGYRNTQGLTATIRTIPAPLLESYRIEGSTAYDMKQVSSDLGIYGVNVLAKP